MIGMAEVRLLPLQQHLAGQEGRREHSDARLLVRHQRPCEKQQLPSTNTSVSFWRPK